MKKLFFLLAAGLFFGTGCKKSDETFIYFTNSDMTPGFDAVHVSLNGGKEQRVEQGKTDRIGLAVKAGAAYTLKMTRQGTTYAELSSPCSTVGKENTNVTVNWKGGQDWTCE